MVSYGMPTPNGPNLNYNFFGGLDEEFSWFKLCINKEMQLSKQRIM